MRMFIIDKKLFPCPVFPDFTIFVPDIPPLTPMYHPYGVLFLRLLCFTTDVPPLQGFHHTAISLFHPPAKSRSCKHSITPSEAQPQPGKHSLSSEAEPQTRQAPPRLGLRPGRHSLILSLIHYSFRAINSPVYRGMIF